MQTSQRVMLGVRIAGLLVAVLHCAPQSRAAEPVDYLRDVQPVLRARCFACHGSLKQSGGLRLDTGAAILRGGESGPAVVAGKSVTSALVERIASTDEMLRMPQEGAPLTALEIERIRQWIDAGAVHPDEPEPLDPLKHWSFLPPAANPPTSSPSNAATGGNPIDAYIASKYPAVGLKPVGPADKHTLLRRVYIDLTGLPPTRAEIQAFLADPSATAYEQVVDRLLASPRYGQRWGRHWMDVWRYSDWDGFGAEVRESQPHVWRWRDWIVESLNGDKPYDQMIVEMLAGDELAPGDPQAVRATGYLVRSYYKFNRNNWLENTVEHSAKAFQALTLNCARCHDHKYDPIAQQEYYQWRAAFEPYDIRIDPAPGEPDTTKNGLARVFDSKLDAPTYLFVRGDEKHPDSEHPLAATLPRILGGKALQPTPIDLPAEAWYPGLQEFASADLIAAKQALRSQADAALLKASAELAKFDQPAVAAAQASQAVDRQRAVLADTFASRDEQRWTYGKGAWEYTENRLKQNDTVQDFCMLLGNSDLPTDFLAKFKFVIRGGEVYRSVGLSFDATDTQNFSGVYLTAHAGGESVQAIHRTAAADAYPAELQRKLPVELNQEYELQVAVRQSLVNVWVDGKLMLAYKLPKQRPAAGKLALWTCGALADFLDITVQPLPEATQLVESPPPFPALDSGGPGDADARRAELVRAQRLAQAKLAALDTEIAFFRARAIADRGRYTSASPVGASPTAETLQLIQAAVRAERAAKVAAERVTLITARQAKDVALATKATLQPTAEAIAALDAPIAAAQAALAAAENALAAPGGDYTHLGALYPKQSSGRRLALARQIASRTNPLTARVAVNHIWLRHFGSALVPSVFDFGHNGKPPVNRELLDFLAVLLMQSDWKMKSLHRLMVTSQTYRLASSEGASAAENRRLDRDNVYLWHSNPRRLEAEAVRDSVLLVDGRLDETLGGPDLDPATDAATPRRSLYFRQSKEKRVPLLAIFDQANAAECYRRAETVVPQQALAMANSPLVSQSAQRIAASLTAEVGAQRATNSAFVEQAFLLILARPATPDELRLCGTFLDTASQVASAAAEPPNAEPAAAKLAAARERLVHTLLNHHDFVTAR